MKNQYRTSSIPVFGYMTEQEARTIRSMVETLEANGIPQEYYHVGGYAEEAACMEKTDAGWVVYVGERGNRYQLTTHKTLDSACKCLLNQVAESDEQYQKMTVDFKGKCKTLVLPVAGAVAATAGVAAVAAAATPLALLALVGGAIYGITKLLDD